MARDPRIAPTPPAPSLATTPPPPRGRRRRRPPSKPPSCAAPPGNATQPPRTHPRPTPSARPWAQSGDRLTTAQGLRVDDADNSLTAGERGPTLLEDFHLREKIMHFDHERIPERVVHARGAGAHGVFEADRRARGPLRGGFLRNGDDDAGVRALLDRGRLARFRRHRSRRARLRDEVLHRRGQLRPRRQQHPGVLHPGRA